MKIAWCRLDGKSGHEAGRELLEKLYREETGDALPEIAFGVFGKPYFPASDLHFSITHSKNHAFCVLSHRPVGIDAEEEDRKVNLGLAEKILSSGEKEEFDRAADRKEALLRFWVLKEASVKLTGEGLHGYPNQTNFTLEDPRVQKIDGCLVAVLEE